MVLHRKPAYNNQGFSKICLECGTEFHVAPSRMKKKFYCSQDCYSSAQRGAPKVRKSTRARIKINGKRKLLSRLLMEKQLGRKLTPEEEVHHKDGNHQNDDPDNLEVKLRGDHTKFHSIERHQLRMKKR